MNLRFVPRDEEQAPPRRFKRPVSSTVFLVGASFLWVRTATRSMWASMAASRNVMFAPNEGLHESRSTPTATRPNIAVVTGFVGHNKNRETNEAKFVDPTHSFPSKEMKVEGLEDSIKAAVRHVNTSIKADLMSKKSILLPLPMDLWRRNISLDAVYSIPPPELGAGGNCSCRNPMAKRECCMRTIHVTHKMGHVMTNTLFRGYQRLEIRGSHIPVPYPRETSGADYRDVLMFRNIYAALKSGYLYHLTGRECWLSVHGEPHKKWNSTKWRLSAKTWNWFHLAAIKVPMSVHRNRSLCDFLREEDEKEGMRAYIKYVFGGAYKGMFALWALAQTFPEVRERTKHACYEDFLSPNKDKHSIESALRFLFNQTMEWEGGLPGQTEYVGPHSTSHNADPDQSRRLLQLIRELDKDIFNNEIAWVDSVLPC